MLSVCNGYIKRYAAAVGILSVSVMVLVNSEQAAEAVRRGIGMCVQSVIPSLFPMIFLSQYLIKSGGAEEIGSMLNKPTKLLFGLPGVCGVALLTGMFGGFPAGARAAETLTESGAITRRQGQRLATIAFCSGPGFTIGMVGAELYKNKSAGLLILTAQIISSIIIGMTMRLFSGKKLMTSDERGYSNSAKSAGRADAFVESASDAASTVIAMSSFIVVFQVIAAMLDVARINAYLAVLFGRLGAQQLGECIVPCIIEVTGGSILSVNIGLPFTAFVVGFGGLSVHFQNFAVCRKIRLNKLKYIFVRLIQGGVCTVIVSLALELPCFAEVCSPVSLVMDGASPVSFSRISVSFGVIMLVMCLMSVICLPNQSINFKAKEKGDDYEPFKILRKKHNSVV